MAMPAAIVPSAHQLHLRHLEATATEITAVVETIATSASCPLCGRLSGHVHSRYVRTVADVPWHGVPFRLRLHVRRFFCEEPSCQRAIFTERLPDLVAPYARRTIQLDDWLRAVGFAVGGAAGTRLLQALGLAASADTLLRQVRRTPVPATPAPRVVGVDDWCFRRGRRYGAILVDLERRHVLDLLPDGEADTLAAWLQTHPSVEVISRDRGASFAEGASRGAPQARQVADRFHVLKNLVEAFQQVLGHEHDALRAAAEAVTGAPLTPTTRPRTALQHQARETAQARRQVRYETVRRLRAEGKTIREIATDLGMGQNTIQRLLRAESCPLPAQRRTRSTVLTDFEPYLRERWNAGEQNGQQLLRELREQGYRGSQSTLYGLLGRWRTGPRHRGRYVRQPALAAPLPPPVRTSPREVSWLLLQPSEGLSSLEAAYVSDLLGRAPVVATTQEAVQTFFSLLDERQGDQLDAWLERAEASGVRELAAFAEGIRRDADAIRAAFEVPWSQGQTEGQVNRLKLLKRQM
ncbi:MAG: ISL3 family transposase, partial [Ktedonobacterales bacterium]|nr:ISL3 family transposase [Ktedonobacterales bacterium]